jgi:hypothetical protein
MSQTIPYVVEQEQVLIWLEMLNYVLDCQTQSRQKRTNVCREERKAVLVNSYGREQDLSCPEVAGEGIDSRAVSAVSIVACALRKELYGAVKMVFEDGPDLPKRDQSPLHAGKSAVDPCVLISNCLNNECIRESHGIQVERFHGALGRMLKHSPVFVWGWRYVREWIGGNAAPLNDENVTADGVGQCAHGLFARVPLSSEVMLNGLRDPTTAFAEKDDVEMDAMH